MSGLQIDVARDHRSAARVALTGHLDADTSPGFRERMNALRTEGAARVVLDCAGLDYLSSQGVTVIFEQAGELRNGGGDLVLAGLHGSPLVVLEQLSLDKYFQTYDTAAAALDALVPDPDPPPGALTFPAGSAHAPVRRGSRRAPPASGRG